MCYVKHLHKHNYDSQDSPLLMKLQSVLNNIYTQYICKTCLLVFKYFRKPLYVVKVN